MRQLLNRLAIISVISLFSNASALAGSMITSTLDDLVSENNNQVLGDSQERLLSIMGLSPDADVGLSMWYRHNKSNTSSVLSGEYMSNDDTSKNYILRHTFPLCAGFSPSITNGIADNLNDLQIEAGKRLALQLNILAIASDSNKQNDVQSAKKAIADSEQIDVQKRKAIQSAISACPNIIVISWSSENEKKSSFDVSSLFKGKGSSVEKVSGYAVIAGLRSNYVVYGSEYKEKIKSKKKADYYYTVTSNLQAQAISYVSGQSFQRSFLANLNIPLDDVTKYLSDIKKLGIEFSFNQAEEKLNFGSLGVSQWSVDEIDEASTNLSELKRFIQTSTTQAYAWKTIYSVRTKRCDTGNWFNDDKACQGL